MTYTRRRSNPLGRIKLLCPNRFNVYLHDTPAGHLFQERGRARARSHGCIRVERPLELAEYLMQSDTSWTREKIEAFMDTAHDQTRRLPERMPVHILYWTAWADGAGHPGFRDDVYGMDEMVSGILGRRETETAAPVKRRRAKR